MDTNDHKTTRITLERVMVTTVRHKSGEPVYCDLCHRAIEVGVRTVIESPDTKLLTTDLKHIDNEEK
ncbi:MAG TPA: hypothetical protein PLP07_03760 [Pyrinomonadaceae bacterium]|nr:hypothetical protein [Chloracidobacterium sp.]MBP9936241.1 hypothetical protein [Pyrinomonadaceae bacterium]MBK7802204.1 hypothetical protein [Chloracidobacterium sp.]MBK9437076.1 hypothetical protein [Chloracidobacterium sp.]MBK9767817.1 hypothetical protein [Chloracidobacterium sp.]